MADGPGGLDGAGTVWVTFIVTLPIVAAVARAAWFPTGAGLDRWLVGRGLATDGPGRDLARSYLRQTRWIRTAGFAVAWAIGPLVALWSGPGPQRGPVPLVLIAPFAVAVIVAELVRPRPEGTMAATAPRLRRTYVPAFTRWDPAIIAAGFSVMIALAASFDVAPGRQLQRAALAAAAWLTTMALQRWILSRPQRGGSLEVLRVDDAIRSTGATAVSSLGYGVSVSTLGPGLADLASADTIADPGRTVLGLVLVAVVIGGLSLTMGLLSLTNTWLVPRLRDTP